MSVTPGPIATLDPGSRFSGLAVGEGSAGGVLLQLATTIPTRRTPATADRYLEQERADIAATANAIVAVYAPHAPLHLVSELARDPYFPPGLAPQAYAAIVRNFRRMERLAEAVEARFLAIGATVARVNRNAWAHAIVPGKQGGVSNIAAHAAAREGIDPASPALPLDVVPDGSHALDAIGILLAALRVVPAPRASPPRLRLAPSTKLERRRLSRTLSARRARRAALAPILSLCRCGKGGLPRPPSARGRHDARCPARGLSAAARGPGRPRKARDSS